MSVAFAGQVGGQVKVVSDRLTTTRAAKLDNLDALISSRAPGATALSTTNWPGTRGDLVDLVAQVSSGVKIATTDRGQYYHQTTVDADAYTYFVGGDSGCRGSTKTGSGSSVYETALNLTSSAGVIRFLGFASTAPDEDNVNYDIKITVDGSVILDNNYPVRSSARDSGFALIGNVSWDISTGRLVDLTYGDLFFSDSFLAEIRRNDDTTSVRMSYRHVLIE